MTIKLYVGNLPMEMTETELKDLFTEAGNVASAKIITDRQTGQPRGFGFVEMETKLEGQKAISMLNGRQVEGRVLAVNEARPQARTGGGGGGGGGARRRRRLRWWWWWWRSRRRSAAATGKPPAPSRAGPTQHPMPAGSTRPCRFFCEELARSAKMSMTQESVAATPGRSGADA